MADKPKPNRSQAPHYLPTPEEIEAGKAAIRALHLQMLKEGIPQRSREFGRRIKQLNHRRGRSTWGV